MNVSPAVLLLSVSIGVPLLLLALGVLYHAYVLGRQQPAELDDLGAHVEALATESTDALLIDLRDAVEHMQGQLARQRESLSGLLSEQARAPRTPLAAAPAGGPAMSPVMASMPARALPQIDGDGVDEPRMAAGSFVHNPRMAPEAPRSSGSLTSAVADLVAEGLSDRAIARQLHIGLEEVRMARMRVGR
ncbi:MAG: hypothetical protein WC273_10830 [Dehalococcoidia bacterium]